MKHRFINIEGNIGAGKTSLCDRLSAHFDAKILKERFDENPFLTDFYTDIQRYGFATEVFFLNQRYHQLHNEFANTNFDTQILLTDFSFYKSLIFAQKTLNTKEFKLFKELFEIVNHKLPKPDIFVYLRTSIDRILQNIARRGRLYEKNISVEYLQSIDDSYMEFIKMNQNDLRCVIIDTSHIDFVHNDDHFAQILTLMQANYEHGVTEILLQV